MSKKQIATFLGTGKGLVTVGGHAHAYSGLIGSKASNVSHLLFTSGNYYLVGTIECLPPNKAGDPNNGNSALFTLSFNGVEVSVLKTQSETESMPAITSSAIIIPPRTEVTVTVYSGTADTDFKTSCNIIGRVYDA